MDHLLCALIGSFEIRRRALSYAGWCFEFVCPPVWFNNLTALSIDLTLILHALSDRDNAAQGRRALQSAATAYPASCNRRISCMLRPHLGIDFPRGGLALGHVALD